MAIEFCQHCDASLTAGASFCGHCGKETVKRRREHRQASRREVHRTRMAARAIALIFAGSLLAMVAVFLVIPSVAVAYLVVKRKSALTGTLDVLVMLPLTIAGTVLGIALVNTFNTGWLVLTGTWIIMALAYFLRRIPNSVRAAVGPLHNVRDSIEEASVSLGVPPLRSFFRLAEMSPQTSE